MRTSAGLRSWSWMFFLMRDWFLDIDDPFLLRPLARELAREMVACSKFMVGGVRKKGLKLKLSYISFWFKLTSVERKFTDHKQSTTKWTWLFQRSYIHLSHPTTMNSGIQNLVISLVAMQRSLVLLSFSSFLLIKFNLYSCSEDTFRWPARAQLCPSCIYRFSTSHARCILLRFCGCMTLPLSPQFHLTLL